MSEKRVKLLPLVIFVLLATLMVRLGTTRAAQDADANEAHSLSGETTSNALAIQESLRPVVIHSSKNDVSAALRSITPRQSAPGEIREIPLLPLPKSRINSEPDASFVDSVLQGPTLASAQSMPPPIQNFEGVSNVDDVLPPDPNGDVGPNHYVQTVNLSFAIWDKTGTLLYGPADNNTLWVGFGGACEETNNGDPIVLYDHLADRWFMSQFALPFFPFGPFYQCIAVSQSGDPTGAWYRYEYVISETKLNDYPKFGVWPDAYYITVNQFDEATFSWGGQGVGAFERDQMLNGQPADLIFFDLFTINPNFGGMLPSDLDGPPPPPGTPNYFAQVDDDAWGVAPSDRLSIWEFHVDWSDPLNSTFGIAGMPDVVLDTAPFDSRFGFRCTLLRDCIAQPFVPRFSFLDVISDRLMYRLQYRTFGSYQTLVTNHTVNASQSEAPQAGVRWYELRDSGGGWTIFQQGTFAPDSDNRWMASAAMDGGGNIAVGYTVSGQATFPSIRYAGRLAGDPPGTLPQEEATLIEGGGSQIHRASRWGDYSMMAVDPTDDCTFWFTHEYYPAFRLYQWHTRIGSFKFQSCP